MAEWALGLSLMNLILIVVLWTRTYWMTKMLFLIGQKLGWNDERGHPIG